MSSTVPFEATAPTIYDKFFKEFEKYVSKETETVSLSGFHDFAPTFLISNSDDIEDVKISWNRSFMKAVKELDVKNHDTAQPDWQKVTQQILNHLRKNLTKSSSSRSKGKASIGAKASSSATKSPSNSSTTVQLTPEQWDAFDAKYQAMETGKKWELEEGVFVEDIVYNYAKTMPYEHAAHSFIVNFADPTWKKVFSPSQLKTVEQHNAAPLAELPPTMATFFEKFKGINDNDALRQIADEAHFHYTREFDADWAKRCISEVLSFYQFGVINKIARYGRERDVIMRVWRAIDTAFDDLDVDVLRSDQQSAASSARHNEGRRGDNGEIRQKVLGAKPDMIIAKNMLEYGSSEHGFFDEAGVSSKEQYERYIKLPKTMKDMLVMLSNETGNNEEKLRALRVVGFSHTHLRMAAIIMDSPAGYICRAKPLKEQKIPMTLEKFYDTYIPFLEQVYKLKQVVRDTIETVTSAQCSDENDRSGFASLATDSNKVLLLPSALNVTPPSLSRKRKASDIETDVN